MDFSALTSLAISFSLPYVDENNCFDGACMFLVGRYVFIIVNI